MYIQHQSPTTLTLNGRNRLEDYFRPNENFYYGLETQRETPKSRILPSDTYESEYDTDGFPEEKSYSFNVYTSKIQDNWSSLSTVAMNSRNSLPLDSGRYQKQNNSGRKYQKKRPKPLQYENQKYYDHVFPKRERSDSQVYYKPSSFERAEL